MAGRVDGFDLDRSIEQAWARFTDSLAEVLSMMDPLTDLRIGASQSEREADGAGIRFHCDAGRSLVVLADPGADPGAVAWLAGHGWRRPDTTSAWSTTADQEESEVVAARAVAALRSAFGITHPAFLRPDQLAEVLAPVVALPQSGSAGLSQHALNAILPASVAELRTVVATEVAGVIGHPPLTDADGDLAMRVGSAMVFVRCTDDAEEVIVFSPLVHDVAGRGQAMEVLGNLNAEARYLRFFLIRDRVFASMSVLARPLVPAHLQLAIRSVTTLADGIDEELAEKLHGRTTYR